MNFDAFFDGYVECALWSSTDDSDPSGGKPLDEYDGDLTKKALASMRRDCRGFLTAEVRAWLAEGGWSDSEAGHDFWLTRNRHGTGFWDRGLGEVGDRLTEASRKFGECYLFVVGGRIAVEGG